MKKESNIAFIDGQNLHLGTTKNNWKVDLGKFRTYLKDKYAVSDAYYHLGFVSDEEQDLYDNLQKMGFIVQFREHSAAMKGKKKGNVDTDIVFEAMRALVDNDHSRKILLVSGDGDYRKLVDYLIAQSRLKKILFPNRRFASSLYRHLSPLYYDALDNSGVKSKIEYVQKPKGLPVGERKQKGKSRHTKKKRSP
ncbi:NYN domain-containing protein [Candidatus Peregrinibacteria bacterium]|nr:NYN domain-containing protein [Candidatus Peregrinibacteria bacterium]